MSKFSGPAGARMPQQRRGVNQLARPAIGKKLSFSKAGGASLVMLAILFFYIFYQNLPSNFGLNEPLVVQDVATPAGGESTGNTQDRIFKVLMLVVGISVIATNLALVKSLMKRSMNVGFMAFMVLIPLSAIWSYDRNATLLRFVSLASVVMVCLGISLAGWHRQRFQQLTIPPLMYILIVSLLVGAMYPDRIIERGDDLSQKDAWHGITLTKNQFGMAASLGVIIFFNKFLGREGSAPWAIIGTLIAFTCLILSRSNTSLLSAMIPIMFMVMVMRVPVVKQRYTPHLIIGLVVVLILYECVIQDVIPGAYTLMSPIRAMTGKDGSLSGRTIIWDAIKEHIRAAPWLGTGYGAYWTASPTPESPSYIFMYLMFFYPSEAHNGYLDIVNDLGYVGLICLAIFLISYVRQGIELMKFDRTQAALYLSLLFHQLVMNMSESEWFARDTVFTVIMLGVCCMGRALHEGRLQARAAAAMNH
jgi:exopolysaccharide production protein ExoQ